MKRNPRLLVILALALWLRVWGIGFGLPETYHADEPIVVNHAVAYGMGDLHPHFFKIPPLVSYLLFLSYGAYFAFGGLLGRFSSVPEFAQIFVSDPSSFYLLARVLFGALAGTLTVYLLTRLIAKHFSRAHGLLTGLFLAGAFLHVRDSHYVYADIPLLLVLVSCFFFIFRVLETGRWQDYAGFGVLAGTAVSTKYNGVFIFVPFFLSHLMMKLKNSQSAIDVRLIGSGLIAVGVYFLFNPFSLLDWRFFSHELFVQGASQGYVGFIHHLRVSLLGGLGAGLWAAGLLGAIVALFRPERKRIIFLSFLFFYYCPVLVFLSQPYDRYALPLVPFMMFFAADFLIGLQTRFKFGRWGRAGIIALVLAPSLIKAAISDHLFTRKDTRTLAEEYVKMTVPLGAAIALDTPFYMPRLKPVLSQLNEKKEALLRRGASQGRDKRIDLLIEDATRHPNQKRYELHYLKDGPEKESFMFSTPALPYDLEALKGAGIQYVIVARIHEGENKEFHGALRQTGKLAARFTPYKDPSRSWAVDREPLTGGPFLWEDLNARERNGPIIEIYELA